MDSEDWAVGPQIVYISPQSYSSQSDSPRDTQKGDEDTPQAASINPQYLFTLSSSLGHSPKHTLEDDENTTRAATFPGDPPKDTGIIINPQRKARKERAKKESYPCGFLGKRCEFMLNKSGFKDCAKLKEDALRHINGYQCLTCGARFGKPYGLKRHHLNKTKCTKRDCELVHPALLWWMRKLEKAQGYSLIKSAINHCKPYCDMNTNSQSQHKARKNKFNGTTNTQHEAPLVPNPLAIPDISPIDSDASGESHPDNDIPDNYMTSGSLLVQPEERLVHVNDGGFALVQQRGSQGLASNVLGQDNSDVDMSYGGYPESRSSYSSEVSGADEYSDNIYKPDNPEVPDTQDHFSLSPARPTTPITPFINYEDFNHGQGYSHAPAIADPQGPSIYLHTGTSDNAAAYSAATPSTPPQDLQGHNSAQHQDPLYSTINYPPLVYPSDSPSTDYNQLSIRIANDDLQLGDASETLADLFWEIPTGFTG